MGPSVLVVCGDESLCAAICAHLARVRIDVQGMKVPPDGSQLEAGLRFDVVLSDIDLPDSSGCEFITRLRLSTRCGIVALSSGQQRESRVLAMRLGADQFFSVPLDYEELELTLRNLHRRLGGDAAPLAPAVARTPAVRTETAWRLDATQWTLTCPQGESTQLSFPEYRLLQRLTASPGEVVPRDDLRGLLERGGVRLYGRNLDMMMSRLRRKVRKCCEEALPVHSARGIGYVFNGRAKLQA